MLTPTLTAAADPRLTARVISRRPMYYAGGADPAQDRPAHLRAASAIVALSGGRWAVVQDDALFLAVLSGRGGEIDPGAAASIALEAPDGVRLFDEGRGNKKAKADLEAACRWEGSGGAWLVGFGSGSTARRERLLIAPEAELAAARLVEAPGLYARLRAEIPAGAELNVEGALQIGPPGSGALRLLQRGNGIGGVDAAIDVAGGWLDALLRAWGDADEMARAGARAPEVLVAARWELGELDGVRLTFTDGSAFFSGAPIEKTTLPAVGTGRWLFSAAAEASPDAIGDGPVVGSAIGWAGAAGGAWAPLVGEDGEIVACKLEGIAVEGRDGDHWRLRGVVDADDPDRPSELLTLRLEGPWAG